MTAGPVYWGSYPGEFLERVMAVLVAQDHPDVIRRTPASGDGGVDLLIPDGHGFVIEQVKGFHDRLGSSERAQIKRSWDLITTEPRLGRPITAYRLVVPVDPTPDEQEWFEALTEGAPFPVSFRGKPHWDSLASHHPHVIDYMLAGGREQVRQRARALLGGGLDPSRPLTAMDVAASFDMLRMRLNREDPHYRYQFMSADTLPNPADLTHCAVAETRITEDGTYLTIMVIPRHQYALDDEPISGSLEVRIEDPVQAQAFTESFRGFTDFGRALDLPEGSLFATIDLPGGLGGEVTGGGGRIGPAIVNDPPKSWRVAVRDADDTTILEVPLNTTSLTRGPAGGAELVASDRSGILCVTLQLHPPVSGTGGLTFNLTLADPTGQPVRDVAEPIRLMSLLQAGHRLVLLGEYGSKALTSHVFEADSSLVPAPLARHIDDLATIQPYADFAIVVPEEIDPAFARELHTHARMLRGEVITGSWDEITLALKPGVRRDDVASQFMTGGAFIAEEERVIQMDDDQAVPLGRFSTTLADARLASEQPSEEDKLRLVPGSSHAMSSRSASVREKK